MYITFLLIVRSVPKYQDVFGSVSPTFLFTVFAKKPACFFGSFIFYIQINWILVQLGPHFINAGSGLRSKFKDSDMRRDIVQSVNWSWRLLNFELTKVKVIQVVLLKLSSSCWLVLKGLCHLVWVPDTFVLINQPEREEKTVGLKVDGIFFYLT